MMGNNKFNIENLKNYICLKTNFVLDKSHKKTILYFLKNFNNNECLHEPIYYYDEKNNKHKKVKIFYYKKNNMNYYCFPTYKFINEEDLDILRKKLEECFDFDFKLISKSKYFEQKKKNEHDKISLLSKLVHKEIINDKINKGWRYGIKYSKEEKTDPNITNWENLNKNFKRKFMKKIYKFYKIFTSL